MRIVRTPFSYEINLDEVRRFLLQVYRQSGQLQYLIPTKIENQKFGPCGPDYSPSDDETIKVWRSSEGDSHIVAVSHRGSAGNYHIEIHPGCKHMERDLFQEIEELERGTDGRERSRMYMYTVSSDSKRPQVLKDMGYEDFGLHEYNYWVPPDSSIPENPIPDGFTIRDLSDEDDYPKFIEVIGSAYEHCRQHMTLQKMKFMAEAEFFHPDLNLVGVDPTGKFAGFCMYRLDPITNIAEMESLDTHPDFRDQEIEKALLSEGLRRLLKHKPALICSVEVDVSDSMNQLLESAGFVRSVTMNIWGKMI